ncbi:MAG: hypothetical protein JXA79_07640 [Deltaproteobacteria bacterium]|nr:hypothetical protein [Deltaproteobacteria bacterium]
MITTKGLKDLLGIMEIMAANERLIGNFYQSCAETWEQDRIFWLTIAAEEEKHAKNIQRMAQIISLKPEQFQIGRFFNMAAIQTVMAGIRGHLKRLKEKQMTRGQAIFVARDIESSLIEKNYGEIVKTGDIEYLTLMKEVTEETEKHKESIERHIQEIKAEL